MLQTPSVTGIGQVAITVTNLDQSLAFYRDALGLPFLFKAPPGLAFLMAGSVRLMLSMPEGNGADASHPTLYYAVPDIHAAYAALKTRSVPLVDEPHVIARMGSFELWMFFVRDPDGHLVGLMSETPAT